MNHHFDYDSIILGAGPGGYVAAIRAAQLKQKVAVIEKEHPGGVCLNVGCIPTKSLIHQAEVYHSAVALKKMGMVIDSAGFNYSQVVTTSRSVADTLSKGVAYLLKKKGVTYIQGTGELHSPHEVCINQQQTISGRSIIIATGSKSKALPGFTFDESTILSSTGALFLEILPKKLTILGAGAIGVEFAHIMNTFGVAVHLVELQKNILPLEDREISETLRKLFIRRGITISTETKAAGVELLECGAIVTIEHSSGERQSIETDKVLVVTGRTPNTGSIGLERVGIVTERGCIPVGDYYETAVPGVYAIGDVIASPQLAHVASKEGEIAAEHAAGLLPYTKRIDQTSIPAGIYCEPQVASFGLTEQAAVDQSVPFVKATFPYRGVGKSVAIGAPEGLVKLLADPSTKKLIGAHIIGAQATELIHELLLAKSAGLMVDEVSEMIHAHPTLSEGVMEAARMLGPGAIHV